nr:unnamed protein product [Callosobruchus chinensis]
MLASLAPSSVAQYDSVYKQWWSFCHSNDISLYQATVQHVIQYINMVRSTAYVQQLH